jgi:hypothetical protein
MRWRVGGEGYATNGNWGELNDLWTFNPSTNQWAWEGGSNTVPSDGKGQPGVYGTLGSPAAANSPGGRVYASSWTDSSGNIWLFGGGGFDAYGNEGNLNDLWEFQPLVLTPSFQVNGAAWQAGNAVSVTPDSTVNLKLLPLSGGTWSWTGPSGFTSASSEIDNIPLSAGANTYTATYTDPTACSYTMSFILTVQ